MTRHFKYCLFLFIAGLLYMATPVKGQVSSTFYHMYGIPQANQLNPAFQPQCRGHVGMPILSPLSVNIESNGIQYGDLFKYDSDLDQMITFMHPKGDKDAFIASLQDLNIIRVELGVDPVSIGWRRDKFYFTLDWNTRVEQDFRFTKDFMEFGINLTKNQDRFSFGGMGVDARAYHEMALGFSYKYDDNLQVGVRGKLLLGLAELSTKSTDITLKTEEFKWEINSNSMIRVTAPYLEIPVDENGNAIMDSASLEFPEFGNPFDFMRENISTPLGTGNPGFAVDLGVQYKPLDFLSVSASVVDLGFIRWRKESYTLEQDGSFVFEGMEIDPGASVFGGDETDEESNFGSDLLDSISNQFDFTVTRGAYTSMMTGKAYLGVAYEPLEWLRLGAVDRIKIYNYKMYNQFTLSANIQPIRMFSFSLSYSVIGNYYTNFGLGLSLKAGPFNMYFITDQAPGAYLMPETFNSFNFRFGMNIVWGCAKIPKKLRDKPLID